MLALPGEVREAVGSFLLAQLGKQSGAVGVHVARLLLHCTTTYGTPTARLQVAAPRFLPLRQKLAAISQPSFITCVATCHESWWMQGGYNTSL